MRKFIIYMSLSFVGFFLIHSTDVKSQNFQNKTSCFAHVVIQDSMITIWIGDPMQSNFRMHPQVFYDHVFYYVYPFTRFCTQMVEIKKEVERIKQHLASVNVEILSEEDQLKLLEEIALSLIWNNLFKIPKEETEQQLAEVEKFKSKGTGLPVRLVNHLYHQVFDGN